MTQHTITRARRHERRYHAVPYGARLCFNPRQMLEAPAPAVMASHVGSNVFDAILANIGARYERMTAGAADAEEAAERWVHGGRFGTVSGGVA